MVRRIGIALLLMTVATAASGQEEVSEWLAALRSPERAVRVQAAYAPPDVSDHPAGAVAAMTRALHDDDPFVRRQAAAALGEWSAAPDVAVPALIAAMEDRDDSVRRQAVVALAKFGAPAVPALLEALRNPRELEPKLSAGRHNQTNVRVSDLATIALQKSSAPVIRPLFEIVRRNGSGLTDNARVIASSRPDEVAEIATFLGDPALRSLALQSLGGLGSEAVSALPRVKEIASSPSDPLRVAAVRVLAELGPAGLRELAALLPEHPDPKVREAAVGELQWWNGEAVKPLTGALRDANADVRAAAGYALAELEIADTEAIRALAVALGDEQPSVRKNAAYGLRMLVKEPSPVAQEILPALIAAARTRQGDVQEEVAMVLGAMGPAADTAIPALARALRTPPGSEDGGFDDPRPAFIEALGRIGRDDPRAMQALIAVLRDPERDALHDEAVKALGALGESAAEAAPLLAQMLRAVPDDDWAVYTRHDIATALAKLGNEGVSALLRIAGDGDAPTGLRVAAVEAAGDATGAEDVDEALRAALATPELRLAAAAKLAARGDASEDVLSAIAGAFMAQPHAARDAFIAFGPGALPAIRALLEQPVPEHGEALIEALLEIRKHSGADAELDSTLIATLRHRDAHVREAAAEGLATTRARPAEAVPALIALLKREIQPGADFRSWRETGPGSSERFPVPAAPAFRALAAYGPAAAPAIPALREWAGHADAFARLHAVETLGRLGEPARAAKPTLLAALDDAGEDVRIAAVSALETLGFQVSELDDAFSAAAIDNYLSQTFARAYDAIADELRPSTLTSGGGTALPKFPWPNPPTPAHIAVFGQAIPRTLLGEESATLGAVHQRLLQALFRADPAFESGVFGVPGGFALLAKTERIREDGTPFPPPYRWTTGHVPPLSLGDYLGQLFFEKPGYFRVLAFVLTTEEYSAQQPAQQALPEIRTGAQELPDDVAREALRGRKAYLLVYSFARERGGRTRDFKLEGLSAFLHLQRSGVLATLTGSQ